MSHWGGYGGPKGLHVLLCATAHGCRVGVRSAAAADGVPVRGYRPASGATCRCGMPRLASGRLGICTNMPPFSLGSLLAHQQSSREGTAVQPGPDEREQHEGGKDATEDEVRKLRKRKRLRRLLLGVGFSLITVGSALHTVAVWLG